MPLTTIQYGSLASSSVMNDNFGYLDNKITTVSGNLTTVSASIYSSLSSMNSTYTEQIEDITSDISDLETDLGSLRDDFDSYNIAPNYSQAVAINYTSGDEVGFDGWLAVKFRAVGGSDVTVSINSVPVLSGLAGTNNICGSSGVVLVSSDDVLTWSGPITDIYFYKIPFLGGE